MLIQFWLFNFLCYEKMQIKLSTVSQYFSSQVLSSCSLPHTLEISPQQPASPFPLPSIHPLLLLPPGTALEHCPFGLCNTEHPSFPHLSPNPSQDAAKKSVTGGGPYGFTWQFLCLYKGCKHTEKWPTTITPCKCIAHSRLLQEVIWQIL